ncbi:MAG: hypothetical protein ACI8QT_000441 [Halioglobus sp.]|jgi:hypothetical protein
MLVATAALTCISVQANETHYRWLDRYGNPVHSDRPPPKGTDYQVITSGTSLVRKVDSTEGAVPAETSPSVDNKFNPVETANPKTLAKNTEFCKRAKENLAALNSKARIRMKNDQGETYILTEEDKEEKRAEARSVIGSACE